MNPTESYDPKTHVVAGGLAGALASMFTQPLDVAKTLLQTKGVSSDRLVRQVSGLKEAFTMIRERYGWAGFFRGWRPRILTHIPATAISWTTVRFTCIIPLMRTKIPDTLIIVRVHKNDDSYPRSWTSTGC